MMIIWIIVFVAALVIELLTPSALVSIWFSIGALVAALCALLGLSPVVQIIACVIVSIVFIIVARPFAVRYMRGNTIPTNADRLLNESGIVVKTIEEDVWGAVKVRGVEWSAVSSNHTRIEIGARVRIDAIEGAKLLVHEIEQ